MTHRTRLGGMLLAGLLALTAGPAFAQEKKGQEAALEAWMKAATPGPEHERLAPLAGSWTGAVKMWMAPGQPPTESTCTAERKWILGGRFLQEEVSGRFMGQPFGGFGLTGYDNLRKKYTGVWTDTLTTALSTSQGTADASGKVITFTREDIDPVSGKPIKGRDVVTIEGKDKHSMVMYKVGPDGKEEKVMEIVFTRHAKGK